MHGDASKRSSRIWESLYGPFRCSMRLRRCCSLDEFFCLICVQDFIIFDPIVYFLYVFWGSDSRLLFSSKQIDAHFGCFSVQGMVVCSAGTCTSFGNHSTNPSLPSWISKKATCRAKKMSFCRPGAPKRYVFFHFKLETPPFGQTVLGARIWKLWVEQSATLIWKEKRFLRWFQRW